MAILAMISTAFENAISESLRVQSLEATENGGTSSCRWKREPIGVYQMVRQSFRAMIVYSRRVRQCLDRLVVRAAAAIH
jgi:hypothetical protein